MQSETESLPTVSRANVRFPLRFSNDNDNKNFINVSNNLAPCRSRSQSSTVTATVSLTDRCDEGHSFDSCWKLGDIFPSQCH